MFMWQDKEIKVILNSNIHHFTSQLKKYHYFMHGLISKQLSAELCVHYAQSSIYTYCKSVTLWLCFQNSVARSTEINKQITEFYACMMLLIY